MQNYLAALTIILLAGMVLTRALMLKRAGIQAMNFGKTDKSDFLVLPFVLFYFYLIFAAAFGFPTVSRHEFFSSGAISWVGVFFCFAGLLLFLFSLISFGNSFRIGIDEDNPDKLITTGVFSFSRNPIYVAFGSVLLGQFLVFPNWILLLYLGGATWLVHRQVLREEEFLKKHYGNEFLEYCDQVRRYF